MAQLLIVKGLLQSQSSTEASLQVLAVSQFEFNAEGVG
jgi:hypothetical protein